MNCAAPAYGHTRLGEWIFGGVTRDLFTQEWSCAACSAIKAVTVQAGALREGFELAQRPCPAHLPR
jgi:hypothetical protein